MNKVNFQPLSDARSPEDAVKEFQLTNASIGWLLNNGNLVIDLMEISPSEPNLLDVVNGQVKHSYVAVEDNGKKYCTLYCADSYHYYPIDGPEIVCPEHGVISK